MKENEIVFDGKGIGWCNGKCELCSNLLSCIDRWKGKENKDNQ